MSWGFLETEKPSWITKLSFSKNLVQKAIKLYGDDCAASWSGGKDSTLVLWMARQFKPNIKVLFENTYNEFPETIQFIRRLTKEWNLNLIETKPYKGASFKKLLDQYGLPKPRQTSKQGKQRTPKCCLYLKEKPAKLAIKQYGIKCILTGITSAESENRWMLNARYEGCKQEHDGIHYTGFYYWTKDWQVWKYNPIMNWKEKEVFDAHRKLDIPLCEVYTKWNGVYDRLGCLLCTAYNSWEKKLPKSHPKAYLYLKGLQEKEQTALLSFNVKPKEVQP